MNINPSRPRLLDLFCGAGGAAMGYSRAGFNVTGVDIAPQKHYPFTFIQADALEYVAVHGREYDVIHASPPCQGYTGLNVGINKARGLSNNHPKMIEATRSILMTLARPYVIENVVGAPLRTTIILCGTSLGLERLARHRLFESSVMLWALPCAHNTGSIIGVYGDLNGRRISPKGQPLTRAAKSLAEAQEVMGIDWMFKDEIVLAIPPAYTEYIGRQLMQALDAYQGQAVHP